MGATLDLLLNLRSAWGASLEGSPTGKREKYHAAKIQSQTSLASTLFLPLFGVMNLPGLNFLICKVGTEVAVLQN